jgi:hypothetical protein
MVKARRGATPSSAILLPAVDLIERRTTTPLLAVLVFLSCGWRCCRISSRRLVLSHGELLPLVDLSRARETSTLRVQRRQGEQSDPSFSRTVWDDADR